MKKKAKVKVYFKNNSDNQIDAPTRGDIKSCVKAAILRLCPPKDALYEVTVTLCKSAFIRRLNARYRNKDRATDTLSFPIDDFGVPGNNIFLGDIFISAEIAALQAAEYGHSYRRELCFLAVHSTLHLLGIHHEAGEKQQIEMERLQEEILRQMDIGREK